VGSDLELTHRFMHRQILEDDRLLSPAIAWQDEPDRGYNLVKICTWDRAGLFSKIAGSFSAVGLNILSAQIFTRSDGVVLDKFFVNDVKTGNLAPRERQDKFTELLGKVLNEEGIDLSALIAREINNQPAYQAYAGEHMATQIYFDNGASDTRTLVEIETEDRLGLLYVISQTFTELALDIAAARIVTERGAAIDTFYVHELGGGKVVSAERQLVIENRLRDAIKQLIIEP
jgi:[protein-PII] uridylyltransferase